MLNNTLIISNNKLVKEKLSTSSEVMLEVMLIEGTLLQIMEQARDLIHKGCILLTHPLSGSIKPNQTPYKSIALAKRHGPVDFESLTVMEESITRARTLISDKSTPDWPEKYLKDFRVIDLDLIKNALKL